MNFNWDGCAGFETLIRKMILGDLSDLRELFKDFGKEGLKKVFLENLHRFQGRERSFWKIVLEVSDEELEARARENFRETEIIKNFPRFLSC